jgi:hypothetical protein
MLYGALAILFTLPLSSVLEKLNLNPYLVIPIAFLVMSIGLWILYQTKQRDILICASCGAEASRSKWEQVMGCSACGNTTYRVKSPPAEDS